MSKQSATEFKHRLSQVFYSVNLLASPIPKKSSKKKKKTENKQLTLLQVASPFVV